jgi:hypothetical protein
VARIVVWYEPSNAVTGATVVSGCIDPIEPAQPAVASTRTMVHSLTSGTAAILHRVARREHALIVGFPLMLSFCASRRVTLPILPGSRKICDFWRQGDRLKSPFDTTG